jgi:hypothetical protein
MVVGMFALNEQGHAAGNLDRYAAGLDEVQGDSFPLETEGKPGPVV